MQEQPPTMPPDTFEDLESDVDSPRPDRPKEPADHLKWSGLTPAEYAEARPFIRDCE